MTTAAPKTTTTTKTATATATAKTPLAKTSAKAPTPAKKPAAPVKVATKAKPVAKAKPTAKPAPVKTAKVKKPKMVRDSFTMPKPEFAVLDVLKARASKLAHPTKKTELIRAGIKALAAMSDAAFLAAIKAVPNLKTGRPAKSK
ncbi:hypothetical protein [Rhodoferax saidenbachensis]|uniref:Uncharacterized protein n=1 Tax=Rhodoferax saidenbachensis TaxID=1484693 RepID=A0A1P8K8P3_9BURK|nr:hypothetical protein [Rhodoferax saidenbachensis]APW42368.1 hypothetical protein RS694_07320 [Rhodoferax saidenbachensis]